MKVKIILEKEDAIMLRDFILWHRFDGNFINDNVLEEFGKKGLYVTKNMILPTKLT